MSRTRGRTSGTAPIWIATLGFAAGTGLVLLATRVLDPDAPAASTASSGDAAARTSGERAALPFALAGNSRSDTARSAVASEGRAWHDAGEPQAESDLTEDLDPRKVSERALRSRFLARERAAPGTLVALAPGVFDGSGPEGEKNALLRALGDIDAPDCGRWLAHVVLDAAGMGSETLRDGALRLLAVRAKRDELARVELEGLVFGSYDLPITLRRRAAAWFAAVAAPDELARVEGRLSSECDDLLVAGVCSALEERRGEPGVDRLLGRLAR